MTQILAAIIGVASALLTAIVTSIISPHVQWRIEEKREQRKHRREIIENCRRFLENNPNQEEFSKSACYAAIRPYLSSDAQESVEKDIVTVVMGIGRNSGLNPYKVKILDELARLEKEWNFV